MAIPTQLKSRSVGETVLDAVTTAGEQIYTVLSTKLLLRGEYSRSGDDLIIRGEMGEELRVEGYFSGEASPTLQSPEGAVLLPTTVSKLLVNTESVDVAGPAGSIRIPGLLGDPIGTINDIGADANVTAKGADGFVRALKPGDPIYIDDVVETVGRSFVNLLMVDDTSFQLGKDTRAIIENYNFIAGAETGGFEATVLDGFFRYASGQLGGTDKGTHTTIKTPTAQVGVRGSEFEGMIEADGATTFLHHDGVLDVADAYGRGSVTLTEPGTATAVSSRPGAPLDAFEAPESLTKAFEEALPPLPDFVVEAREGEGSEEGVEVQLEVGLDEQIEVGLDEQSELEIESFELKQVELKELLLEEGAEEDGASISAVPVATADQFSGVEDQVISGNLGSNDKKGDGSHTWSKVGNATFGEVVVNADGTFTYHPSADFSGNDQFSYQVVDKDGDDSTAVVSISLSAINDAPEVVLAEGGTKTFIESSMATLLFSDAEVTTVESGQQLTTLVVTVEGLADGINEQLWIGNESIVLDGAISSGQIAGQSYITSLDGNTATVTLTGSWNEGDIINQLGYKNSSLTPTESSRLVTLKSLSDDGGTLKGGVDSQIFASGLASTVQITGINTAPTVVQGITTASYTEMMGATLLFSDAQVSTVESGQQLTGLVIEVSGLVEASSEQLWIGSESIKLDGSVASGQIGGKGYTVSVDQNVATVTLSGSWNAGEVIRSLGYKNSSQTPTESNRMVTLKSLSDDGGTLNGGENSQIFASGLASTVQVIGVNTAPVVTPAAGYGNVGYTESTAAAPVNPVFLFRADQADVASGVSIDTIESNQQVTTVTIVLSDTNLGDQLMFNGGSIDISATGSSSGSFAGDTNLPAYSYQVSGPSITFSGGWSETEAEQLVNAIQFKHIGQDPTASGRTTRGVSLSLTDETAGQGDTVTQVVLQRTIDVTPVNQNPVLDAAAAATQYIVYNKVGIETEQLFSFNSTSTVESGQNFTELQLTVSGVVNGSSELLKIDGQEITLSDSALALAGNSTTISNYKVETSDGNKVITLTGNWDSAGVKTLVNSVQFSASQITTSNRRTVQLNQLKDSGNRDELLVPLGVSRDIMVLSSDAGVQLDGEGVWQYFSYDESQGIALFGGATQFELKMKFSSTDATGTLFTYKTETNTVEVKLSTEDGVMVQFSDDFYFNVATNIGASALFDGKPHTLSLSWDNVTGKFIVGLDGVLESEQETARGPFTDVLQMNGEVQIGSTDFNGAIYDVQVTSNVAGGRSVHWGMEEITGETVVDSNESTIALTATGSPVVDQQLFYIKEDVDLGDLFYEGLESATGIAANLTALDMRDAMGGGGDSSDETLTLQLVDLLQGLAGNSLSIVGDAGDAINLEGYIAAGGGSWAKQEATVQNSSMDHYQYSANGETFDLYIDAQIAINELQS